MSSPNAGTEVSDEAKRMHREAEKALKEAKSKMASQVKVLLLGSGDSGKSTILKQMRLIHKVPFSSQEIENYRQLVFNNLTFGLRYVLEAMEDMELEVADDNAKYLEVMTEITDLSDGEPFPVQYLEPLKALKSEPPCPSFLRPGVDLGPPLPVPVALIAHSRPSQLVLLLL